MMMMIVVVIELGPRPARELKCGQFRARQPVWRLRVVIQSVVRTVFVLNGLMLDLQALVLVRFRCSSGLTHPPQNTAASPFFECRLLNLFLPLTESESGSFLRCLAVGTLTPSSAPSPPIVLDGLDSEELRSLKVESPEYEFVMEVEIANSFARSIASSHSAAEYLLPSGSLVVALGSSKTRCLSRWWSSGQYP